MRDPARIPIVLNQLRKAWELCPDLRLAQLLCAIDKTDRDLFFVEDEQWLKAIEDFIEQKEK